MYWLESVEWRERPVLKAERSDGYPQPPRRRISQQPQTTNLREVRALQRGPF